jgi:Zn-dependent M16 (insulinase) family peptidase
MITGAWSEKDRTDNAALVESLRSWQTAPDTPDALGTLPMLKKEDADIPPEWPEALESMENGVKVLFHEQPTGGIVHLRAYFRLTDLPADQLQQVNLLCSLLGKLPTEHYDSASLQQAIRRYTGRLSFAVTARSHPTDPGLCSPCLAASLSITRRRRSESTLWIRSTLPTTCLTLLVCR